MNLSLLYAGNVRVFDGMVISLCSVVRFHKKPIRVFLLTADLCDLDPAFAPITGEQRDYLEKICTDVNPESRVTLIDVGDLYRKTLLGSPNEGTSYTPYTFLRLYADRLPELPDKLLYLDTDTLLCGDAEELFSIDLDGYELAGVRDFYGHHFFGHNYLNAGVLLLNLPMIRKTGLFRRAVDACAEKKIFLPDQTALNRLAVRKKILPRRFNEQRRGTDATLIRHFSMTIRLFPRPHTQNVKPWHPDDVHRLLRTHRYDEILNEYLKRLPEFPASGKESR